MVKEFSQELFNIERGGEHNAVALNTLRKLKEKAALRENLFADQDQGEFDRLAEQYPDEYQLLLNQDAFHELNDEQKMKVLFEAVNGHTRPADPVIHELD